MKFVIPYDSFTPSLNENASASYETEHVMLLEDFNTTMTVLKNAINNKLVCTIYYKGERKGVVDDGYRYIEPYALGVNAKGNTVLRGWLLKGKSRRGRIDPKTVPGWRLFRIDRISSISTSLQAFTAPRKGYNADDNGMTEVMYSAKF
jgi:predicted DNA-binding transcriptional regulator YafY